MSKLYSKGLGAAIALIWVIVIVSFATYEVFVDVEKITGTVVAAYTALLGLPAIVFGFYKWRNNDVDDPGE